MDPVFSTVPRSPPGNGSSRGRPASPGGAPKADEVGGLRGQRVSSWAAWGEQVGGGGDVAGEQGGGCAIGRASRSGLRTGRRGGGRTSAPGSGAWRSERQRATIRTSGPWTTSRRWRTVGPRPHGVGGWAGGHGAGRPPPAASLHWPSSQVVTLPLHRSPPQGPRARPRAQSPSPRPYAALTATATGLNACRPWRGIGLAPHLLTWLRRPRGLAYQAIQMSTSPFASHSAPGGASSVNAAPGQAMDCH